MKKHTRTDTSVKCPWERIDSIAFWRLFDIPYGPLPFWQRIRYGFWSVAYEAALSMRHDTARFPWRTSWMWESPDVPPPPPIIDNTRYSCVGFCKLGVTRFSEPPGPRSIPSLKHADRWCRSIT